MALVISTIILAMLMVGFFVVAVAEFSAASEKTREYDRLKAEYDGIIRATELTADRVRTNLERAGRSSLVDFLLRENAELKTMIIGSGDADMESLKTLVADRTGGVEGPLAGQIASNNATIARLNSEVDAATRRAQTAIANAEAEANRVGQIRSDFDQSVQQERTRVGSIEDRVDEYDAEIEAATLGFASARDELRSSYESQIDTRDDTISNLNQTVLVLRDQLTRARGEGGGNSISPPDEFALIDGEVVEIDPVQNVVIIDLGRRQKVQIGQTFSVYSLAGDILPDPQTGVYAPGKGSIEVIQISQNSARARILRSSAGNPIVRGDKIANPLYDPNKVYRMVVYGTFDINGDGIRSALERGDVENLINRWGGVVQQDIAGDTDFLVLGARPELPVAPSPDSPREVVLEYVRLRQEIERYDELLRKAQATSLPVLSENRLRTLVGDFPD